MCFADVPNLSTFFWVVATFDEVVRYEFGRLHQNGPEIAQPASPVVEFTLTNPCTLVSRVVKPARDGDGRAYAITCFQK